MNFPSTQSVESRSASDPRFDATHAHARFLEEMARVADMIHSAFDLKRDPCSVGWETFGNADRSMMGSMNTYSGPQLDWVVESWLGNPEDGFTHHHLTVWMPPTSRVPHLGISIGTNPELYFYLDYIPRTDLWTNVDALDRYHDPLGEHFLALQADPRFKPMVTRNCYLRQAQGPSAIMLSAAVDEQTITDLFDHLHGALDRWIEWVLDGDPVPVAEQPLLAARDRQIRRSIIDRNPSNVLAFRALGEKTTLQLLDIMSASVRGTPTVGETP